MTDPAKVIASRLRNLRIALGFTTQVAFAQALGIAKHTYNPFEKGTRDLTFDTACRIRVKFKIPIDWLFWGDGDELPYHVKSKLDALMAQGDVDKVRDAVAKPRKARRNRYAELEQAIKDLRAEHDARATTRRRSRRPAA